MSISDRIKKLLADNQIKRLSEEKERLDRRNGPRILRHTTYEGDRKIRQLGDEIIENGVILNNQSLAIGDVMLPLAKGNVLRRVDNTNGGALLGSAYRKSVENDFDPNGDRRSSALSRNGGNESSNPPIGSGGGGGGGAPSSSPPPFGCTPPPPQCFWTTNPIAPDGFQNHGDAVVNENGVPLYLHCIAGTAVSPDLNCEFLGKWSCSGGVCSRNPNGIYNSQAECEAALIPPNFTGGQCVDTLYTPILNGPIKYVDTGAVLTTLVNSNRVPRLGALTGLEVSSLGSSNSLYFIGYSKGVYFQELLASTGGNQRALEGSGVSITLTGSPDNCGDAPSTCPT